MKPKQDTSVTNNTYRGKSPREEIKDVLEKAQCNPDMVLWAEREFLSDLAEIVMGEKVDEYEMTYGGCNPDRNRGFNEAIDHITKLFLSPSKEGER